MKFTEAQLESAIIEFLEAEGYPHVLGEAIDPPDGATGRQPQEVDFEVAPINRHSFTKSPFNL
ncbi:hypothetical protein ACFQY0_04230 [Haloferula chungangensis]|uniref:Uncharacterized protein n=1 Tax=Haloferula chungangensis TaxID=1048331 RepID=A0ABW2L5F2_9BACT